MTVIAEAIYSLSKNPVRTSLSIFGIVIGIAAVISMLAVGTGTQNAVKEAISLLGDDWIVVWYQGRQRGGVRKQMGVLPRTAYNDAKAIREQCPGVRCTSIYTEVGDKQVISSYGNHNTEVKGVEPDFFSILRWMVQDGREMTDADLAGRAKVCWLGMTVVNELFGTLNPVGQTIRIDRHPVKVAGVLAPKGSGGEGEDFDDAIIMPLSTLQSLITGNRPPRVFFVAVNPGIDMDETKEQVRLLVRERHRVPEDEEDPIRMFDRAEEAELGGRTTHTFKMLVTFIGSISLLVGGVGIMNIMLVSVTERTREIGLRMAIGAKSSHILTQFLCEAVMLCGLGGVLGILFGWFLADFTTAKFMADLAKGLEVRYEITYWMVFVAIGVSTSIGIFFGFYPAWRASRLDPINALRYE